MPSTMPLIMRLTSRPTGRLVKAAAVFAAAPALACTLLAPRASAQTAEGQQPGEARPTMPPPAPEAVQTIFLKNASEQNDLNDIQTDLRNMLPRARIYGVQSQFAITLKGTPEDVAAGEKLVSELDRPRKQCRLTYTVSDIDGGNRIGSQQFVVLAAWGQRSTFKQGSRVPIVTGTSDGPPQSTQVQYVDIGMNIDATVSGSPDGLTLRTKVEQSSLADEKAVASAQDPVVRQTVLQETAQLTPGKPAVIGSLDIPGSTRRQEISVVAELVP